MGLALLPIAHGASFMAGCFRTGKHHIVHAAADWSPIILACASRFGRWPWIADRDVNLVISRQ